MVCVSKKKDGNLRLSVDPIVTLNTFVKMDHYFLTIVNDIFNTPVGYKMFFVLDLSNTYLQDFDYWCQQKVNHF